MTITDYSVFVLNFTNTARMPRPLGGEFHWGFRFYQNSAYPEHWCASVMRQPFRSIHFWVL